MEIAKALILVDGREAGQRDGSRVEWQWLEALRHVRRRVGAGRAGQQQQCDHERSR